MRDYTLARAQNLGEFGSSWFARLYRNWKARKRISQLENYDDFMLNDIGLTREEVSWAAGLPLTVNAALALEERAFRRRKNLPERPGWGVR